MVLQNRLGFYTLSRFVFLEMHITGDNDSWDAHNWSIDTLSWGYTIVERWPKFYMLRYTIGNQRCVDTTLKFNIWSNQRKQIIQNQWCACVWLWPGHLHACSLSTTLTWQQPWKPHIGMDVLSLLVRKELGMHDLMARPCSCSMLPSGVSTWLAPWTSARWKCLSQRKQTVLNQWCGIDLQSNY